MEMLDNSKVVPSEICECQGKKFIRGTRHDQMKPVHAVSCGGLGLQCV